MSETDERCSLIVSTLLDADGRLVFDVFDFDEAYLDRWTRPRPRRCGRRSTPTSGPCRTSAAVR